MRVPVQNAQPKLALGFVLRAILHPSARAALCAHLLSVKAEVLVPYERLYVFVNGVVDIFGNEDALCQVSKA